MLLALAATAAHALPAPGGTSLEELALLYRSGAHARAVAPVAHWSRDRVRSETRRLLDPATAPAGIEDPDAVRRAIVALLTESALSRSSEEAPERLAPRLWYAARLLQARPLQQDDRSFARCFYLIAGLALHWHLEIEAGHDLLLEALRSFPDDPELLTALGSIVETVATLREYQLPPGSSDARSGGYSPEAGGPGGRLPGASLARAAARYEGALASDPELAEARLRLGRVRLLQGRLHTALAHLERVAAEAREPRQRYLARLFEGRAREELGDLEGAAAALRAAVWQGGGTQTALLGLGRCLDRLGDRRGAQRAFSRIGLSHPPFDPWWSYAAGHPQRVDALLIELRELVR